MINHARVLLVVALALGPVPLLAQAAVRGVVIDSATGAPLNAVHVKLRAEASSLRTDGRTDAAGHFAIAGLPLGTTFDVDFSRVGYASLELHGIALTDSGPDLHVALATRGVPLDPVVVSASRSEQTRLDAPASVSVIERRDIQADGHLIPLEQIRTLPGVDFVSKGLIQHTFELRGAFSGGALLMLTDYRYAEIPSVRLNNPYLVPTTREDIDHIELVRGPAAALYGPGGQRGVLHIVTRSPFESPGGVVSVSGGERAVAQGTFRYAAVVHPRLAASVSGNYVRGDDWHWVDPRETRTRDYLIQRAGGEARLDWRPGPGTEIVTKSGVAEAINNIELTGLGAVQVHDWRSSYWQTWLRHGRLFANAMYNMSDAGETFSLRTGLPIVDRSRAAAAQVQHGHQLHSVDLLYGADVRWTDPRTGGTINGRFENDDRMTETGAYAQATTALGPRVQLITAVRADYHSRLGDFVVSPRVAIVFKPRPTQALRLTYNRAFNSPPPNELFLDIYNGSLGPYGIRLQGIPPTGYTFNRACGGLCMHSPYDSLGQSHNLAADATLLWDQVVAMLKDKNVNLNGVPTPTRDSVSSSLAVFNGGTQAFEPVSPSAVQDVGPLRREIYNALELGYKAEWSGRVGLGVDLYVTRVYDRVAPSRTALTPNVFFDRASLEKYLLHYRSPIEAESLAAQVSRMPMGTVSPIQSPYPIDLLFGIRQGQKYTLWGVDVAAEVALDARFSVSGTVSWVSYDTLAGAQPGIPVILSIPWTKGSLRLAYRDDGVGLAAALQARAVSSFPLGAATGGTYGESRIAGYGLVDLSVSRAVGATRSVTLSADVTNLFNNRHREIAGAPAIGRLGLLRFRMGF